MKKRIVKMIVFFVVTNCYLASFPKDVHGEIREIKNNKLDSQLNAGVTLTILNAHNDLTIEKNYKKGYTSTNVNLRELPTTESNVVDVIPFNQKISYSIEKFNDNWCYVKVSGKEGYMYSKYIKDKPTKISVNYTRYIVPNYSGKKTYMPYRTNSGSIFYSKSKQYQLQQYAYTGTYGIRQVDNRYCVALGSYFTTDIGQYFDLVLANGEVISCILADSKSDRHTDSSNIFTVASNCCSEFIVDTSSLVSNAKRDGDVSSCTDKWKSPVVEVRIYNKNFFK